MTCSANPRRLCGAALILLALTPAAAAHDAWINREQRRNAVGEWCCNATDCSPLAEEKVKVTPRGYVLETGTVALTDKSAALRENPDVQRAYLGA